MLHHHVHYPVPSRPVTPSSHATPPLPRPAPCSFQPRYPSPSRYATTSATCHHPAPSLLPGMLHHQVHYPVPSCPVTPRL
eukprot:1509235-Rhodomonas_salina.1